MSALSDTPRLGVANLIGHLFEAFVEAGILSVSHKQMLALSWASGHKIACSTGCCS